MGLLDDLRLAASELDPSLAPSMNEAGPLLGALVHYTEHGDAFLSAAADGPQALSDFLTAVDAPDEQAKDKDKDAKPAASTASASGSSSDPSSKK